MGKKKHEMEGGVLSIPNCLLDMAGISRNGDLIIETVPGVILIGEKEPVKTVNQPLLDLFQAIGIEPEEVARAIETMTEGEGRKE